ncbi:unnamed protein product [Chondrus crispus]|uniref:Uncharacterized protein n=1 Tax=Chondrus crispus TaxID=2769 RepID=R7Q6B2_CHOCR|nr:unnamed protein product [Chondrus crispus]CDF33388.1 unnamed protein product [Chondrus crispus]|eukprot:XP_005713191.1 unnamed protein product [Chondrus crispus]
MNFIAALTCFMLVGIPFLASRGHASGALGPCRTEDDCSRTTLQCRDAADGRDCSEDAVYCFCLSSSFEDYLCSQDSDCADDETCIELQTTAATFVSLPISDICLDNAQVPFLESPKPCESDEDCDSNAACVGSSDGKLCVSALGSEDPEGGAQPPSDSDDDGSPSTENPAATEDASSTENDDDDDDDDDDSDICIAVSSLGDVPQHQFVFSRHAKARVLCDKQGSCATRGHMVQYGEEVMMMQTYCQRVRCTDNIMLVNSLRYSRQAKFPSRTDRLMFTTFAARYNTAVEENVLRFAIYSGL